MEDPGIVDQHVQAFVFAEDLLIGALHRGRIADVRTDAAAWHPELLPDFGDAVLECIGIGMAVENHRGAVSCELARRRPSDAPCGAGNEGNLPFKRQTRLHTWLQSAWPSRTC